MEVFLINEWQGPEDSSLGTLNIQSVFQQGVVNLGDWQDGDNHRAGTGSCGVHPVTLSCRRSRFTRITNRGLVAGFKPVRSEFHGGALRMSRHMFQ